MTGDDNLLVARLQDALLSSNKKQFPSFIGFLNEHEISVMLQSLKKEKVSNYRFFGGYSESERCILAVAQRNVDIEDYYFPITGISFSYKPEYTLSHRDFLGSLMSLGIKRELIGDILIGKGCTVVFVKDNIKDYIITQIQKIGKIGVTVTEWNGSELPVNKQIEIINCTVSSARLDCVVSAVMPFSREKSATLIKQGMVFVNSMAVENISSEVKCGDKISVRGNGKFVVGEFSGLTKKGRLKLTVEKYI